MKREKHQKLITLLIKKQSIVLACAEFTLSEQIPKLLFLKELELSATFVDGRIFNLKETISKITTYLNAIHFRPSPTGLIFDTPLIANALSTETIYTTSMLRSNHTQTIELATLPNGNSLNYTAIISCDLLLQYELLLIALELPVIFVSTPFQAYLKAYRIMYGSAFRQSQLIDDLITYGIEINTRIDSSLAARLVHQKNSLINSPDGLVCAGSFYCMKELL